MEKRKNKTTWGGVADWYEKLLSGEGTYQKTLILPNLLRLLALKPGERVLDLACGPGFFAKEFLQAKAKVIGVDISGELIEIARQSATGGEFYVSSADKLPFIRSESVDRIVIVLALQNMEDQQAVIKECTRVLKKSGTIHLVMNHPAFRIPKESSWGWDPSTGSGQVGIQYRRIDSYLSELKNKIQMHPGEDPKNITYSFHKPLQFYFKIFDKLNLAVSRLEEWNSNKKSEPGPRSKAEDVARKEIPLFLYMEVKKI